MKLAAVLGLPFHGWVLQPAVNALRLDGHKVDWISHVPKHSHDWITGNKNVLNTLSKSDPDFVISAEYPYDHLRVAKHADIVGTRHSLAGRRNTWEKEHARADWIVTWSDWDEAEFYRRKVIPRKGFLRAGCVFAQPLLMASPLKVEHKTPRILWAPTFNKELSVRGTVLRELRMLKEKGCEIHVRLHAATYWRDKPFVEFMERQGFILDVNGENSPPWDALLAADCLVSDVSGVSLLALAVPGARLPVVLVDPDKPEQSNQYDPDGPEWVFRDQLGPRCKNARRLSTTVMNILDYDSWATDRYKLREKILGPCKDDPCQKLAMHISDIGINEPQATTG